ncbi:MAG: ribosome maturation factor RimM [Hydrogenophaga sp.]|uniref:ribosome maturation factor RimM n=1 Tax=Hydrogenophaga sp. TaxID=1904254 RepID=UPI001D7691D1|nr:ribosome maturation factor RimM [Hydrogenophaga sp.]MBX3610032.1 ribosome maturation factor RimM [Hydrogenophaga sp.]
MNAALVASVLPADAVELGRVLDAWGIKGWVRIHPHSADTEALSASTDWFLQPPEARFARGFSAFQGCVQVHIKTLKAHADGLVAQIEGVEDRTSAEALKGCRISLPRSAFPEPAEGEYYWVDLIGLSVVNREGVALGTVRDLLSTGPTDVLVLAYDEVVDGETRTAERLIPFVDAYVDKVDRAARRVTVDWQPDY